MACALVDLPWSAGTGCVLGAVFKNVELLENSPNPWKTAFLHLENQTARLASMHSQPASKHYNLAYPETSSCYRVQILLLVACMWTSMWLSCVITQTIYIYSTSIKKFQIFTSAAWMLSPELFLTKSAIFTTTGQSPSLVDIDKPLNLSCCGNEWQSHQPHLRAAQQAWRGVAACGQNLATDIANL